jgi:hypothetical protein
MASVIPSSAGGVEYEHIVPESADLLKRMDASSILTGRDVFRIPNQNGVNIGSSTVSAAGQQLTFNLTSGNKLLDGCSLALTYNKQITTATANSACWDDGAPEIQRITVSVAGKLVEDIDYAGKLMNAQVYASASKSWYETVGSMIGFHKHNSSQLSLGNTAVDSDLSGGFIGAYARGVASVPVYVPLHLVSSLFRTKTLLPLFAMGEVIITVYLAANNVAIIQRVADANANATYALSDVYLVGQMATPSPAYLDHLNSYSQDVSEPGITIPYEFTTAYTTTAITASSATFSVAKGTKNLRKVLFFHTPVAAVNKPWYPTQSCFPKFQVRDIQLRVGSQPFPQNPSNSWARQFMDLQGLYNGEPSNLSSSGLINAYTYNNTTTSAGAVSNELALPTSKAPTLLWGSDNWMWGYNFDSFKGSSEPLALDGVNSLSGGSQVQFIINYATSPGEGLVPQAFTMSTRFL